MSDRRHFLRALCALPMIGGGVRLIGQPSGVATPVTNNLIDAYDEWLFFERKLLHIERYGREMATKTIGFIPCTRANEFHFPSMQAHHVQPPWMDLPVPSSRAALVLSAVGIDLVQVRT